MKFHTTLEILREEIFGSQNNKILNVIQAIRNSFPNSVKIYSEGSCFQFHNILRAIYPESIPYYNSDHVVTKIGDKLYDITGIVQNPKDEDGNFDYMPLSEFGSNHVKKMSKCKYKDFDLD